MSENCCWISFWMFLCFCVWPLSAVVLTNRTNKASEFLFFFSLLHLKCCNCKCLRLLFTVETIISFRANTSNHPTTTTTAKYILSFTLSHSPFTELLSTLPAHLIKQSEDVVENVRNYKQRNFEIGMSAQKMEWNEGKRRKWKWRYGMNRV